MVTFLNNDDSNDHTIDTENTSHDNWDHRFHDELRFEDTHGADTNSSFGRTISSTQVSEDKGRGNPNVSEEVVVRIRHLQFVLLNDMNMIIDRILNFNLYDEIPY